MSLFWLFIVILLIGVLFMGWVCFDYYMALYRVGEIDGECCRESV